MVSQQVNLYLPIFRTQKKIFSATTMVQALGLLVLGLLLLSIYSWWRMASLEAQQAYLVNEREAVAERLKTLRESPRAANAEALEQQVTALEAELAEREQIKTLVLDENFGNTRGFSGHLTAMAQYHVDGVQLTQFALRQGGRQAAAAGNARDSILVPQLLQRWREHASFAQTKFGRLTVTADRGQHQFTLGQQSPEGEMP